MNDFMRAQLMYMTAYIGTFQESCRIAALKNDGAISKEEEKALKQINKAAEQFKTALSKIT